jgi:DNA-binding NtrC family response regulator
VISQKRILIVEDEPIIAEICSRVLSAEGFSIETAGNGRSGKAKVDEKSYDAIIIDLRMPVMDGRALFEYIKTALPDMLNRVIITSGEVISDDADTFITSCGRPFLRKPFSPKQLKEVVSEVLNQTKEPLP